MSATDYKCFAAVQFATQVEYESVMSSFDWSPIQVDGDSQQYYEYIIRYDDGTDVRLVAAKADEMGNVASSTLTLKLIERFRPKYVILVGIAAGVRFTHKQVQPVLGDVVIADRVWIFASGKYVPKEVSPIQMGGIGFLPRPQVRNMNEGLRDFIKDRVKDSGISYRIHIGAMASGSAVVSNREIVENFVLPIVEKTKGLDMESYGVFYATEHASEPRPTALVVKGICDFADERKNDEYQRLAADNSCNFLKYLIPEILLKYE